MHVLAREQDIRRIAFPSISTGVYAYPKEEAARVALSVMHQYEADFEEIIACCYSAADKTLYERLLARN